MDVDEQMAIGRLLHKAACDLDDRDLDGMESCFTHDTTVVIEIQSSGRSEPMLGRDALMSLVRARVAEQEDRRRHVISNMIIDPQGPNKANVSSLLTLISILDGQARVITTGCYRDIVEKRDGRWQIASRKIELDLPY